MMKLISDKSQELIKGDNCFDIIRYYLSFIVVFAAQAEFPVHGFFEKC